jgi:putative ABC transport system permease protein
MKSHADTLAKRIEHNEHMSKEQREIFAKNQNAVRLIPLVKIHFSKLGTGNLTITLSLLVIGIVALVIAYINFINFSLVMAPLRVKSLNVRKIFGAQTGLLKVTVASESVIFSVIAFLLSIFFMNIIHKNLPNDFFSANMSISNNWLLFVFTGIFIAVLGFIIGLYPAHYATSFKPAATLSGSLSKSQKNVMIRNMLTTIQFTIAVALIIIVVFIRWQCSYAVNYSWGIQKENIVYLSSFYLNANDKQDKRNEMLSFTTELKRNPQVLDCTVSDYMPGSEPDKEKEINDGWIGWATADNFLDFFGVHVIEGIDLLNLPSPAAQIVVNKKFAQSENVKIGDILMGGEIAGIIEDVNFENLNHSVRSMFFFQKLTPFRNPWIFIKIAGNDTKNTVSYIKSVWDKFSSRPLELHFLDSHLDGLYKKENSMANLLTIVSIIAIIIALMGIYGLIIFNIRQKEKEIALRKIAGATVWDILLLLNRRVLIQLVTAFALAAPAAYYIANRWLETFAYKISLQWWVFVLCWLLMVAITVATVCMQTYRAATKNPIEALKTE